MRRLFLGILALFLAMSSASAVSVRGDKGSQIRQNKEADKHNLTRLKDDAMVARMVKNGYIVPIPEVPGAEINQEQVQEKFAYVRPWTAKFIRETAADFRHSFKGRFFRLNGATRTVDFQMELRKKNPNAAPAHGPKRSSHLTGASIDIAKLGLTPDELKWFRKRLADLKKRKLIDVAEERKQKVFHIMVYKAYERYDLKKSDRY